jgi:hypothetical protein
VTISITTRRQENFDEWADHQRGGRVDERMSVPTDRPVTVVLRRSQWEFVVTALERAAAHALNNANREVRAGFHQRVWREDADTFDYLSVAIAKRVRA